MGWRMVKELVHWFGEVEDRSVDVIGTPPPVSLCDQLQSEILATKQEIVELQTELQTVGGPQKPFIGSQIKKKQADLAKLQAEATRQGCPNVP